MNTCKCITRKTKEVCNNPAEYITVVWKGSNIYLPGFQSTDGWLETEALVCRMHINNTLKKGKSLEYMTNLLSSKPVVTNNNKCPKCDGAGMLTWTSVDKGRCWQCGGKGYFTAPKETAVVVVGPDLGKAKEIWNRDWRGKGAIKKNQATGNWEIHRNN